MPDIEITEDQRDRLRAVQEALAADVVGKYGHVRASDAVEYLLDIYEDGSGDEPGAKREGTTVGSETGHDGEPGPGGGNSDTTDGSGADDGTDAGQATAGTDDGDETNGTDGTGGDGDGATVTGGDAAELDAMMNLLAEHDERWRETEAAETRYEVDLPDGTTEHARTRDDVRGLLFRHYR